MARIALLEDEAPQAEQLRRWLEAAGHQCRVYGRGEALMQDAQRESFDLFILDWRIPDVSGFTVLTWLRVHVPEPVPVLFSTSRNSEEDVVSALAAGADDYLVKPLRRHEAVARVHALLRRANPASDADHALKLGSICLRPGDRTAYVDDVPVELTQKEFDLAVLFLRNPGRLLSRGHLLDSVWLGKSTRTSTRTVDTHVSALRRKLRLLPDSGWQISSVHHYGYRLEHARGRRPE